MAIHKMEKIMTRVRFPNDYAYTYLENFDISKFTKKSDYGVDVFGTYMNQTIAVNKEDYLKLIEKNDTNI